MTPQTIVRNKASEMGINLNALGSNPHEWNHIVNLLDEQDEEDWRQSLAKPRVFHPKSAILLFDVLIPLSLIGKACFVELRSIILLSRGRTAYYFHLLNTWGERIAFRYVLTIAGIDPDGASLQTSRKSSKAHRQQQILKAIADGDATIAQMMRRLNCSKSAVQDQLTLLYKAGKVGFTADRRTKTRTYFLKKNYAATA